jgi:hypothetical protein
MLNRQLSDFGLNPVLGYIIIAGAFIGISNYVFLKTPYAAYIYAVVALVVINNLAGVNRNNFLRACFSGVRYVAIRTIENTAVALPFIAFQVYNHNYLAAILLLVCSALLVFTKPVNRFNFTLPTPFYSYPFEFTAGFRKTFHLIILAYFLMGIAAVISNFHLGLFALIVVLLICLSYYTEPEGDFFVWIYSRNASSFILNKVKILLLYTTLLSLPITLTLLLLFPGNALIIIGIQCLGYIYIITALLGKYANFPENMILPEIILFVISFVFPPLLIGVLPYFYIKSQKKLKEILT